MSDVALNKVLTKANVFVVFTKDGKKQLVLTENEDDLPINIADIAFAASLTEMESQVEEMRKLLAMGVDDSENGVVLT